MLSNKIFQRLLSYTLLITLLSIMSLEMEGNILIKTHSEIHPTKTTHFVLLSPLLEENDEDIQETPAFEIRDYILRQHYSCVFSSQNLHTYQKDQSRSFYALLNLYITFNTFRI